MKIYFMIYLMTLIWYNKYYCFFYKFGQTYNNLTYDKLKIPFIS
jgi:hypothetical protein